MKEAPGAMAHSTKKKEIKKFSRGVQPTAQGPHAAQDGYVHGPTQNHKCT